MSQHTWFIK